METPKTIENVTIPENSETLTAEVHLIELLSIAAGGYTDVMLGFYDISENAIQSTFIDRIHLDHIVHSG